jgi:hypothetical protein
MITDSGMLMGEVIQSSRRPDGSPGGRITSLLWALHHQGAVLYLPRHIVEEVERDLPRRAKPGDDIELAYRRLRGLYLSRARVIDVPRGWALSDPRVQALVGRHPADLPAAQLAVTIGGCFLLSEDPDLCDIPELGFSAWLEVTHAAANQTEVDALSITASIPFNVAEATAGAAYQRIAVASASAKWALASPPPLTYRRSHPCTVWRATPYRRATSVTVAPSSRTSSTARYRCSATPSSTSTPGPPPCDQSLIAGKRPGSSKARRQHGAS